MAHLAAGSDFNANQSADGCDAPTVNANEHNIISSSKSQSRFGFKAPHAKLTRPSVAAARTSPRSHVVMTDKSTADNHNNIMGTCSSSSSTSAADKGSCYVKPVKCDSDETSDYSRSSTLPLPASKHAKDAGSKKQIAAGSSSLRRPVLKWSSKAQEMPKDANRIVDGNKQASEVPVVSKSLPKQLTSSAPTAGKDAAGSQSVRPKSLLPAGSGSARTQLQASTSSPNKSLKVLVNYRANSSPRALLKSAYGNRDFFSNEASAVQPATSVSNGCSAVIDGRRQVAGGDGVDGKVCGGKPDESSTVKNVDYIPVAATKLLSDKNTASSALTSSLSRPPVIAAAAVDGLVNCEAAVGAGDGDITSPAAGSDGRVLLLDYELYQQLLTDLRNSKSQLLHLQQLLLQDSVVASSETRSPEARSPPTVCSHCMRHLSAIGTLQQENTELLEQLSVMKQEIAEKDLLIETLQHQLTPGVFSLSNVNSQLLSVNNNSQISLKTPTDKCCVSNSNSAVVAATTTTTMNGQRSETNDDRSDEAHNKPTTNSSASLLRDNKVATSRAAVYRRSSSEDGDDVFDQHRRTCRQQSEDSVEGYGSIFDYHSRHASLELDEEMLDFEVTIPGEVAHSLHISDSLLETISENGPCHDHTPDIEQNGDVVDTGNLRRTSHDKVDDTANASRREPGLETCADGPVPLPAVLDTIPLVTKKHLPAAPASSYPQSLPVAPVASVTQPLPAASSSNVSVTSSTSAAPKMASRLPALKFSVPRPATDRQQIGRRQQPGTAVASNVSNGLTSPNTRYQHQ